MTRQRPIAGQRSRRTAVLERPVPTEPIVGTRRTGRPVRPTRRDPLLLVAGLVVVILLVTAGLLTVRARGDDRVEQARTEATAAAEAHRGGPALLRLPAPGPGLRPGRGRAHRWLRRRLRQDHRTVVRPTATEVKAVVKADVAASSVVRADPEPGRGAAVREPDHHLDPAGRPEGRPEPGPADHGPGGRPLAGEQGRRPLTPSDPAPDPAEVLDGEAQGGHPARAVTIPVTALRPHGRRRAT